LLHVDGLPLHRKINRGSLERISMRTICVNPDFVVS
jgi:hypothetical protein